MPCPKLLDDDLTLAPAELAFASQAFRLAWMRVACEFIAPNVAHAARDLLARTVLEHINHPLGEPEVLAFRALSNFRNTLPAAALARDLRPKRRDPDLNVRACRETADLVWQSRVLIDGIVERQRETRALIEGALALISEQRRES